MTSKMKVVTIGSLIKKDLNDSYFLPAFPSSCLTEYRFYNDKKYRVYDCPPPSKIHNTVMYPLRFLCAAGDEVTTLLDFNPPKYLTQHWETWLPDFPPARLKSVDEGLKDDVPIVTNGPIQCIPDYKHSVNLDDHYKVLSKSSIPEIGVSCPKHFTQDTMSFPCVVKVDMSWSGQGDRIVKNSSELKVFLREIREINGWKGQVIFQELIEGIKEVPSFLFYLQKSGNIHWIGTSVGEFNGFKFTRSKLDWDKQEDYKNLVYDQFIVPVANYLHKHRYFGLVVLDIVINDHGIYLVDLNPRVAGETSHVLLSPYMAQFDLKHSSLRIQKAAFQTAAVGIVEKANNINKTSDGKVIVLSAADMEDGDCLFDVCMFAKSPDEVEVLYNKLTASV